MNRVFMPSSGQTTDQLTVLKWRRKVGDRVERGDVLLEIETDKAVQEIESYAKGVLLQVMVKEGDTVSSGDLIAIIGEPGEPEPGGEAGQKPPTAGDGAPAGTVKSGESAAQRVARPPEGGPADEEYVDIVKAPSPAKATADARPAEAAAGETPPSRRQGTATVTASPAAKYAARKMNADIGEIARATGVSVVRKHDVEEYARRGGSDDLPILENVPITKTRRLIAERLTRSSTTVPSYQVEVEIDMSACIDLRDALNREEGKPRVAFHDIAALGICAVAKRYPLVNASYTDEGIRIFGYVNVGIAVATPAGLIVPVVRRTSTLSIRAIAAESRRLIEAVRSNHQTVEMLSGGTVTISNLGMYPVRRFTSILNPPQTCILSMGAIEKRVVERDETVTVRPMMNVTGTFDHRAVDGAYAAALMAELKEDLENPALLFARTE